MSSGKPRRSWKWHLGDALALVFLLLGLVIILLVAAANGEDAAWTLWIAVPMVMFSLAYLAIVSILPIFLGPRPDNEP